MILLLLGCGLLGGRLLAKLASKGWRRIFGWLMVLALLVSAHLNLLEAGSIARMVGICAVLLAAMKQAFRTIKDGNIFYM